MDAETRLELIGLLTRLEDWKALVKVGQIILDTHYPEDIFNGSSGDAGPEYVVALRKALARVQQ